MNGVIVSGLSHSKVVDILRKAEGTVQLTICRDILPLKYSESPTPPNMSVYTEAILAEQPAHLPGHDTCSTPDAMLNRPVEFPPGKILRNLFLFIYIYSYLKHLQKHESYKCVADLLDSILMKLAYIKYTVLEASPDPAVNKTEVILTSPPPPPPHRVTVVREKTSTEEVAHMLTTAPQFDQICLFKLDHAPRLFTNIR